MKRFFLLAVAGLMAGAASLSAQAPQAPAGAGNLPEMPKILNPEEKTAEMTEKYNLTAGQQAAVLELNQQFDGKLEYRPEAMGGQKDFRGMSESERQEFFSKMQDMMADVQERMQQMQKAQKEYDKAIKEILDKDQFKAYRKDQRKREQEMQRMQQGMGGQMGGGFPGGGFPGGSGGGFPGGGFPGGF